MERKFHKPFWILGVEGKGKLVEVRTLDGATIRGRLEGVDDELNVSLTDVQKDRQPEGKRVVIRGVCLKEIVQVE